MRYEVFSMQYSEMHFVFGILCIPYTVYRIPVLILLVQVNLSLTALEILRNISRHLRLCNF